MNITAASYTALFCLHPDDSWLARALSYRSHAFFICYSYEEALLALSFKPAIVFCSVRFGGGQLLELTRKVRNGSTAPIAPFVPLLGATTSSVSSLRSIIKEACLSNGAELVIDLEEMRQEMGAHEIAGVFGALVDTAVEMNDRST